MSISFFVRSDPQIIDETESVMKKRAFLFAAVLVLLAHISPFSLRESARRAGRAVFARHWP